MSEKLPSTPQSRQPDFMQAFDGNQPELTAEQKMRSAVIFEELVEDQLLHRIESVRSHSPSKLAGQKDSVRFDIKSIKSTGKWQVHIEHSRPMIGAEDMFRHSAPVAGISLEFVDEAGNEHEQYDYKLFRRGERAVVLRNDLPDEVTSIEEDDPGWQELANMVEAEKDDFDEERKRNNQPIDSREVELLADALAVGQA